MLLKALFLSLLRLELVVVHASPPVSRETGKSTLKFATKINATGFSNLVEKDRARAQDLLKQGLHLRERTSSGKSFRATNAAMFYTAEVGIGIPPTNHTVLIDTGSGNTWVGANTQYVPTNSSVDTGGIVTVIYGSGMFFGKEWLDTVTLTPDLVIDCQSIGVANLTHGIDGFDGILGLGPVDLTTGTVTNAVEVSTVMNNLYAQKSISQEVIGVFFSPASESERNGELMFGGYDSSVMTSAVNYVPLTTTPPASYFWGINQSISYGGNTILSSTAGVVDTGTTFIPIATEAFQRYQSLTGAILDSTTGLLTITPSQYANLQILSFRIGGTSYDLIPNAQIWPRSLNSIVGGTSNSIYLIITDIGFPGGLAFDFINGYTFLERFYSVFDTTRQYVGFANTIYTHSDTN